MWNIKTLYPFPNFFKVLFHYVVFSISLIFVSLFEIVTELDYNISYAGILGYSLFYEQDSWRIFMGKTNFC
jgi:hypothetical protein